MAESAVQQQQRRNRSSKMRTASSLSSSVALMAVAVLVGALSRTHHVSAFSSVRSKTVTASSRLQYRRGDAYDKWDYYIATTTTTDDEATDTATATATKVEQQHQLQLQRQLEQQQLEQQQLEQLQQLQAQVDEYISYHNKRYHNSVTITAPSSSTAILTKQHHYRRSILQNIATAAILLPHLDAGGITKLASLVVLVRPWLWRGGGGGSA